MVNLTPETIRELTYEDYYRRGLEYYHEGRVRKFSQRGENLKAEVVGSHIYKVSADLRTLDFDCSCPAFHEKYPCKHLLALLLTEALGVSDHSFKELVTPNSSRRSRRLERASIDESPPEKDEEIFQRIKSKIKVLGYSRREYWDYVNAQDEFSRFVTRLIGRLPPTKQTSESLLKLAVWLNEQLLEYDDSDGVLQDLLWQVLCQSVLFLNQGRVEDLKIFWAFTPKDAEFDFNLKIVEAILTEVKNEEIIKAVIKKLENYPTQDDPDFSFSPEFGVNVLADYLFDHDARRFEELALKHRGHNIHVAQKLIEFYLKQKKYEKVLELGWSDRHNPYVEAHVLVALEKLKDYSRLIEFYGEKVKDHLSLDILTTLEALFRKSGRSQDWSGFLDTLEKERYSNEEKIELLLFRQMYVRATDVILFSGDQFHYGQTSLEDYARKLAVLAPEQAVRIYQLLLTKEGEKLITSHHYDHFVNWAQKLKRLGNSDFVRDLAKRLSLTYPTRKRLNEVLRQIV